MVALGPQGVLQSVPTPVIEAPEGWRGQNESKHRGEKVWRVDFIAQTADDKSDRANDHPQQADR